MRWSYLTYLVCIILLNSRFGQQVSYICAIFFPRFILKTFLLIYGNLGVEASGLGCWIGFSGVRISVDGVWGPWCGAI